MERFKVMVINMLLKKYAMGFLVKGWDALKGYKTAIFVTIMVVIKLLEMTGQIPADLAQQIYPYLETGAGFSFMQKLARYQPIIDEVVEGVRKAP